MPVFALYKPDITLRCGLNVPFASFTFRKSFEEYLKDCHNIFKIAYI